ncbi:MAG: Fic family protein [Gemmatimonadetes bacterium]|nr:Fic family protein [Gemmatimonadota bacterium]
MLFKPPVLERIDLDVVDQINAARESLGHALQAPRVWKGLLRRSTMGRAIRGSNSIEGYRIEKQDVVAAAEGEAVKGDEQTTKAIEGYRRAMTYVLHLAKDPYFMWSEQTIKSLHFMMLEHDLDKGPGRWRAGAIFVYDEDKQETVYQGPDFALVPPLIDELVESLANPDQNVPYIVRAALAHLNLTMIHPFRDGNGRMARCLQTLVLGRSGTLEPPFSSIEEYLGVNQYPYYDALKEVGHGGWHPENDARPFIRFCLLAHYYQAHTLLRRIQEGERVWNALEEEVKRRKLPERTVLALFDAAHGYKIVNATYRSAADISQPVASRELTALVDAKLLIAQGQKKGRSYTAATEILELRKKVAVDRLIPNPYRNAPTNLMMTTGTAATQTATFTVLSPTVPSSTGPTPPALQSPSDGQN